MAELIPMPVDALLRRALNEWKANDTIYDLPRRKWWVGDADTDISVSFLGRDAASAVGPAAGPQSQLIQNIVLAWLAGARIFELKTIQINDRLEIPRPCIDARNVGYNVEWSQELRLEESLQEYIGAWWMLHLFREWDPVGRKAIDPVDPFIFDLSVGYDLAGIKSDQVQRWIEGIRDASTTIDALRLQLPAELAAYRDIEVPSSLSGSITLSTFHGCPPEEIEGIGEHILQDLDLDLIVKLNPTLLGFERVNDLVRGEMGYDWIHPIKDAFDEDLQWDDALPLFRRLNALATKLGRRFGVKMTNTLVVDNKDDFFADDRMYLSGQPLHVLAMNLLWALRQEEDVIGDWMPVSFAAGIDRKNFADAVALGLTPITTCTDLLRPGGYGRLAGYNNQLIGRMKKMGARTVPEYIRGMYGSDEGTVARAAWHNTKAYVEGLASDPRYQAAKNTATPKKIGSHLALFDCINCDKCVPVCPNNANFAYELMPQDLTYNDWMVGTDGTVTPVEEAQHFAIEKTHQLACYADFCNECGNCDIFCPEDGGPYIEKPRFFGTSDTFDLFNTHDGFVLEVDDAGAHRFRGRMRGVEVSLRIADGSTEGIYSDGIVEIVVPLPDGPLGDPAVVANPGAVHRVELERVYALRAIYVGITREDAINWSVAPQLPSIQPPA